MARRIAHFSCGAASAVAAKLSNPDEIWYANTGGEDEDNMRFLKDCEEWFGKEVRIIRSEKYASTWELWEKKRYLAGVAGAPCTGEMKRKPLQAAGEPGDVGIIGYTADSRDRLRVKQLRAMHPESEWEFPLIAAGMTKAACLGMLGEVGIRPPRVYAMGFHNANCIPCVKAVSPKYWALMRERFPDEFWRMDKLARELNVTIVQLSTKNGVKLRGFPSDVPMDTAIQDPISPACDLLCAAMADEWEDSTEDK